ncbi:MAG: glutathione S-transferase family protein [Pseudomonadota bacterium]
MIDITFYTNPQSRGRIVRWMLEECGAHYETKVVGYGPEMKSEPYLGINPMGKVPALVYDGKVITECAAIIAFLADNFPSAGLAPPANSRHDYYRWLFFTAGPVEAAATNKSLNFVIPDDKQGFAGYGNYESTMHVLAKAVSANPFIAGANFSAADVYVGSHIGWGLQFGTLPDRTEFKEYFARISERPARIKAAALDDALVKNAT